MSRRLRSTETKPLPPVEVLRALLRYDPLTGRLFWRKRALSSFPDGSGYTPARVDAWNRQNADKEAFTAVSSAGYRVGRIFDVLYLAHRVIFAIIEGYEPPFIDHDDGDRLNNRWGNLLPSTRLENQKNLKMPSTNTSGIVGVARRKDCDRWFAQIKANGVAHYLGLYATREGAIAARLQAEEHFGFNSGHGKRS